MQERSILVFAREEYASLICKALQPQFRARVRVTSRDQYAAAIAEHGRAIAFLDLDLVPQLDAPQDNVQIIGITDGGVSELVNALLTYPRLVNVISTAMLATPSAAAHVAEIVARLTYGAEHSVLGADGAGRVVLLASSERRAHRVERIAEFLAVRGIHERTIASVSDAAEELITNALYDAPHEAGQFSSAVERTHRVELPPEQACEICYGVQDGRVFLRVRDPFGAFTHKRLMQVLDRCRQQDAHLDESRGGAGLGMWRVFSTSSSVSISVIAGRMTEVLVWFEPSQRRTASKLGAVLLSFPDQVELSELEGVIGRFAADHDFDLMDDSFTALIS